jgi:hypothetical protein
MMSVPDALYKCVAYINPRFTRTIWGKAWDRGLVPAVQQLMGRTLLGEPDFPPVFFRATVKIWGHYTNSIHAGSAQHMAQTAFSGWFTPAANAAHALTRRNIN